MCLADISWNNVYLRQWRWCRKWRRGRGVTCSTVNWTKSPLVVIVLVLWSIRCRGWTGLHWWRHIIGSFSWCYCVFGCFYGNRRRRQASMIRVQVLTVALHSCHADVLVTRFYIPISCMDVVHVTQKAVRLVESAAWNKKVKQEIYGWSFSPTDATASSHLTVLPETPSMPPANVLNLHNRNHHQLKG